MSGHACRGCIHGESLGTNGTWATTLEPRKQEFKRLPAETTSPTRQRSGLCRRVRSVVQDATPDDSVVAIASKGDPRLIEIEGRTGLHFPRDAEGRYAGHYPKSSEDAVAHVESLIEGGALFLCLPATASWWLEHYRGLAAWLVSHCRVAARDPETCLVYDLLASPGEASASSEVGAAVARVRSLLDSLLP